jgi:hypothetical protein
MGSRAAVHMGRNRILCLVQSAVQMSHNAIPFLVAVSHNRL